MKEENLKKAEEYYDLNKSNAKKCADKIKSLLEDFLYEKNFHSIESRVKDRDSYLEKCDKRNEDDKSHKYNSHDEITDLIGIRVIANTMSDVNEICKIINYEFDIDKAKSTNKADELKTDKVGYLSVHYIANFTNERSTQTEYSRIKDFVFEIQVRTLLQHAWSEIEHDRSYKFAGGELGDDIKRKFNLMAGSLELLDMQFDELANKVQDHSNKVEEQVKNEEYENLPITNLSLERYMEKKFGKLSSYINDRILKELDYMGLYRIGDIDEIIPLDFVAYSSNTYYGILVDVLIIYDIAKYKQKCSVMIFSDNDINLYQRYGVNINKHFEYISDGVYKFRYEPKNYYKSY